MLIMKDFSLLPFKFSLLEKSKNLYLFKLISDHDFLRFHKDNNDEITAISDSKYLFRNQIIKHTRNCYVYYISRFSIGRSKDVNVYLTRAKFSPDNIKKSLQSQKIYFDRLMNKKDEPEKKENIIDATLRRLSSRVAPSPTLTYVFPAPDCSPYNSVLTSNITENTDNDALWPIEVQCDSEGFYPNEKELIDAHRMNIAAASSTPMLRSLYYRSVIDKINEYLTLEREKEFPSISRINKLMNTRDDFQDELDAMDNIAADTDIPAF